jgi:hypothetical protein
VVAQDMPFDAVCLCPVSLIRRGGEVFFARREDRGAAAAAPNLPNFFRPQNQTTKSHFGHLTSRKDTRISPWILIVTEIADILPVPCRFHLAPFGTNVYDHSRNAA